MPPRAPRPTHFLCIPLVTPSSRAQLTSSLASFQADVTSPHSFNVPKQAVRPLGTLHLTLGVMSFPSSEGTERLDSAVELLKSLKLGEMLASIEPRGLLDSSAGPEPVPNPTLSITLQGLRSMQPAKEASVLYAPPVDRFGVLYGFCEKLRNSFKEAGLLVEDNRPLLLHATIVNMVYVQGRSRGGRHGRKATIDARLIVDRYDDYTWMEDVEVQKVQICKMGAKETEDGDSEYEAVAEVLF